MSPPNETAGGGAAGREGTHNKGHAQGTSRAELRQADGAIPAFALGLDVGNHRLRCPQCGRNDRDRTLSVTVESPTTGVYNCHRCDFAGNWPAPRNGARRPVARAVERPAPDFAARYERAAPAAASHGYLVSKRVQPHPGVRVEGDALLLPMRDASGAIVGLQTIAPNGAKRYVRGSRKVGARFTIGRPAPDAPILISEGYATGATLHEATGHATVVAFDCGNLAPVARLLRERYPAATLVLCADNDARTPGNPGLTAATEAARAVRGLLAIPPEAGDFNDVSVDRGADAVRAAVEAASAPHAEADEPAPALGELASEAPPPGAPDLPVANDTVAARHLVGLAFNDPTEAAVADAFEGRYAGLLLYCAERGQWFAWEGSRWRPEKTRLAFYWAGRLARGVAMGRRSPLKSSFFSGVEKIAQAARSFAVTADEFDRHPMLLATPDGTADLAARRLLPADPLQRLTMRTAVAPAPGRPRLWLDFLRATFGGDEAMIDFVHRALGYSITADVRHEVMFFCHGEGGNGKGVLLNTVGHILGDFAHTMPLDLLMLSRAAKHASPLAALAGRRFVTATEVSDGSQWDEPKVKSLTAADPITANFMRQDGFTFKPILKLWVSGNHKPRIRNPDAAWARRMLLIPFDHRPARPDTTLKHRLLDEAPQILGWLIDGCSAWADAGYELNPPERVLAASGAYLAEQDDTAMWLEERVELDPTQRSRASRRDLWSSWRDWADHHRVPTGKAADLYDRLDRIPGVRPVIVDGTRYFAGMSIRPPTVGLVG